MWPQTPEPQMPFPPIIVTDVAHAGVLLTKPEYRREIKWVISMGNKLPKGWDTVSEKHRLRLEFDDIDRPVRVMPHLVLPDADHARQIMAFAQRAFMGNVLIHCAAGESRSSATALLFLATQMGPGWEAETVKALFDNVADARRLNLRPESDIHPNRLLVWVGDRVLSRQGLLWNALARTMPEHYPFGFEPPSW